MRWGRTTRVKFVGGELIYREAGTPLDTMRRRLEGVKRRMLNLMPAFQRFRDVWFDQTRDVFASEGLPQPWPALSPGYSDWKRRRFPGKTIMRRSDRLYESLTGGDGLIWEATPRTIRYGSRVPYFMRHQRGDGQLPARPTLVLLPETFSELNSMVLAHLAEGWRE